MTVSRPPNRAAPPGFVRLMDRVNHLLTLACGAALGVMVLSVALGVLARFVFTHSNVRISVPWTEEVSRYLMIWTVFLGGAVAARSGKLIGVEFVVQALPARLGRAVKYLSLGLSIVFYALLCVVGWQWVEFGQSQTSPVLELPLVVINLAMVAGGAVMALNTVALVLAAHATGKDIRNAHEDDELEAALAQVKHGHGAGTEAAAAPGNANASADAGVNATATPSTNPTSRSLA
jgi:TRAP-type C4-dicarboxylate transport system permease small subunit